MLTCAYEYLPTKQSETILSLAMKRVTVVVALINVCLADVSHILPGYTTTTTTPPPPPRPYSFQYKAGRYPGHVDRVHQEAGDGAGIIHGSYSYVDPRQKIRTVEYTADKTGFHPALINFEDTLAQPADSETVRLAKEKHLHLYQKIADANSRDIPINLPRDSATVARAKDKHHQLYHRIAEQHAAIAARREAERLAYEVTSVANGVDDRHAS